MMKQKKCKCHQKSERTERTFKSSYSFSSVTTVSESTGSRGDEKPSLSRQCANNWWKLKLADRKSHNELMKIQLLSPFLFCKVYQSSVWLNWAKKAGLLTHKRTASLDVVNDEDMALDNLSDEEIQHTDLMEMAITKLQEKIIEYNEHKPSNTPIPQFLEEILDDIKGVEEALETVQFDAAINKVYNKHWFRAVRKQLPDEKGEKIVADNGVSVNDYAVFLVAWQVCFYMKSVYSSEKPLEAYEKDSQLDSALEIIKTEGNEYFKNEAYTEAIKTYTTVLRKKPYMYIIYGNRALCYLKTQEYRLALSDGRRAIALSPTWDKGQYRYAQALYELKRYEDTLNVLSKAIKICSSVNLQALQKIVKKAMAGGDTPSLCANPSEAVPSDNKNGIVGNGEETDEYANMPELIYSDSDNEGPSEEEVLQPGQQSLPPTIAENKEETQGTAQEPSKEKKKKRRRKAKSISIEKPIEIERGDLITMMKEGSTYLLDTKPECAIREYRKVCCVLQSVPDIISSTEIALLHYSLGWAYQESGSSFLQESLEEFLTINTKYPDMNFPLSYYGKGLVYHKQNRFSQCIVELREALRMCDLPGCLLNCCWPGVDTIIEVSVPENFKLAVEHFLNLCYHPPKPDAICRYLGCENAPTNIYINDPEFKGFIRFFCTENCLVEFHPSCWKKYRSNLNKIPGGLGTLPRKLCFTPDCSGVLLSHRSFDAENKMTREEIYVKDVNALKKELSESGQDTYTKKIKWKDAKATMDKWIEEYTMPIYLTNQLNQIKEEKRRRRLSSVNDKEHESDDASSRTKVDVATSVMSSKDKNIVSVSASRTDPAGFFKVGFDILKYNNFVTDAKATAVHIFEQFERLLEAEGSVDIINCPSTRNFINTLDDNSKLLVVQVGSLRALLAQCPKFSFDGTNNNAVYLTAQQEIYKESKKKITEQNDIAVPEFHDPLFTEKLDSNSINTAKVDSHCINSEASLSTKEPVPIKSRTKKKSESNDKEEPANEKKSDVASSDKTKVSDNDKQTSQNYDTPTWPVNDTAIQPVNDTTTRPVNDTATRPVNDTAIQPVNDTPTRPVSETIEEIDCTKTSANVHTKVSKNKKKSKSISDIIIFNDAKKGEDVEYKIINSPDPSSPRKKEKEKKKKTRCRNRNDDVLPRMRNRSLSPPGKKNKLRTYIEDKMAAEKYNTEPRYCCPSLGENCSCAEIEKFREDTAKSSNRKVRVTKVITIEPEGKESDSDTDDDNGDALANVLELIQNKNNGSRKRLPSPEKSPEKLCVVEVGVQCDMNNIRNDKRINDELMKRVKELQLSNDKSVSEHQKHKERQQMVIENQQAEIKSHKTALEKLRKELSLARKAHQEEAKKLRSELEGASAVQSEDLSAKSTQIKELTRDVERLKVEKKDLYKVINDNAQREAKELGKLVCKNEEVGTLRSQNEILQSQLDEIRQAHTQEKLNHEEIVNRLTNSVTEQSDRTQKVQIAFLEVKKEIVAVKYQQQAAIVQNTINQMQYWPSVPEIQNIRSVWDDFKKHFQSCYGKMQEEFKEVIQKVKDGVPLEDLPPAKYADPPPFPKTPMPNNVPIPSPYFGQPQRMPSIPPGHKPPPPLHNAPPPGIPIPQQQRSISLESQDSSPDADAPYSSSVTKQKQSTSSNSSTISEESGNEIAAAAAAKTDAPSARVKVGSLSSASSSSSTTSFQSMVSNDVASTAPLSSSDSSSKRSSTGEAKTLDFASTVKGFGSDQYTAPACVANLKSAASAVPADSTSVFITESEDCEMMMGKNGEPKNRMFDRIIMRLGSIFPSFTREELRFYTSEYRRMQPQGSLSGMKFDDLILNLEKMIRAMKAAAKQPSNPSKGPPQRTCSDVNQKKKSSKPNEVEHNSSLKAKRTRANHTPSHSGSPQESSWSEAVSRSTKTEVFGQEEPCVICYEDMCKQSISKLHCGHIFHRTCITCWLNEQRTCPICRVHALLPEEYPTLA